jgi:uncharacterized YccA/Bax inhibitor family protein
MRSGNPVLNENTFDQFHQEAMTASNVMTVQGTAMKTLILLGLCVGSASFTWGMVFSDPAKAVPWAIGGAVGGLVLGLIAGFAPGWAAVIGPLYALSQGLFLGAISGFAESKFPGIALQATSATFGTLCALLMAYLSGLIRATENFKLGITAATGGIAIVYLTTMILGFFGIRVPYIHEAGLIGIGFSLFVVVIAALNLVLDFDYIENASKQGAPKSAEWYGAFGLMVTLVWLYIEILRLLIKLNSSREE